MKFVIRELEKEDYEKGYMSLLDQLRHSPSISYETFSRQFEEIKKNPNHHVFIIEEESVIVATCTCIVEPKFIRGGSKVSHIEDVVVDHAYRKHGLGRRLIEFVIEFSRSEGCYKVILDCSMENMGFYKKCGMEQTNVQMGIYLDEKHF